MKKNGIINGQIASVVAKMGHTDTIAIVDAGFPVPKQTLRIDLAVNLGTPTFKEVLQNILSELQVEEIILANEAKTNKELQSYIEKQFLDTKTTFISHEALKDMSKNCSAIIRTGECTPYSNIILRSGVTF